MSDAPNPLARVKDLALCLFGHVLFRLMLRTWIANSRNCLIIIGLFSSKEKGEHYSRRFCFQFCFFYLEIRIGRLFMTANNTDTQVAFNLFPAKTQEELDALDVKPSKKNSEVNHE